jgi:hypothetical protein
MQCDENLKTYLKVRQKKNLQTKEKNQNLSSMDIKISANPSRR